MNKNLKQENVWKFFDMYVEVIYGNDSKVDKDVWIKRVAENAPWILKPETMRTYVHDHLNP